MLSASLAISLPRIYLSEANDCNENYVSFLKFLKSSGSDAKACPIARGKFDSKKHSFGQVHGLI